MKKLKRVIALVLSVLCVGATAFVVSACNGGEQDKDNTGLEQPDKEDPGTEDPDTEDPDTEDPDKEDPDTENPGTEDPDTEDPDTEDPDTENPGEETPDEDKEPPKSDKPNEFIFEAEYTDLDDIGGPGWSGSFSGVQCIRQDVDNASNGYYVSFLYTEGNILAFEFESDIAEKGDLVLRLSTIIPEMWLASDDVWNVTINGVSVDYGDVYLTGTGGLNEVASFDDAIVIKDFDILAGTNVIELETVNSEPQYTVGVNMTGTAPEVDCIKVYTTTAQLTWEPILENTWYI